MVQMEPINNQYTITTTETTVCTINVLANQMVHFSGIIVLETNARVRIRVKDASGNFVQNLRGRYQNVFALTSGATIVTTSNINTSSEISIFENSNSTYRITYDLFYLSPIDQTIDFRLIKDNSFTATLNGMTTMVF